MLTIIGQNQPGLLAELTTILEEAGIEILDFSGQAVGDTAVISIQIKPYRRAFRLLSDAGYRVVSHEHLLVRLEKHSGALATLSRRLARANVDVRGMHIVNKDGSACIVALETAQADEARNVLSDLLVLENPGS
jgi:hypothetical protein